MAATKNDGRPLSISKENIFLHRSHRKLPHVTLKTLFTEVGILTLPFLLFILFFYPELTRLISTVAGRIIALAVPEAHLSIAEVPSYVKPLYGLVIPDRFPTIGFSFSVMALSFLVTVLSWGAKQIAKPVGSWIVFICFILFISAAFFIIMPEKYPCPPASRVQASRLTSLFPSFADSNGLPRKSSAPASSAAGTGIL